MVVTQQVNLLGVRGLHYIHSEILDGKGLAEVYDSVIQLIQPM